MGDADTRYMDNKSTPGKMPTVRSKHYDNNPYARPPPPPLLRTDSVDSQKNTLPYTPDGTPFDDTMVPEVDTGVDAQPRVYFDFENGSLIGDFKGSIFNEVRNTYITRKLNNYEVIIYLHLIKETF